jgi:hypothetical protein
MKGGLHRKQQRLDLLNKINSLPFIVFHQAVISDPGA